MIPVSGLFSLISREKKMFQKYFFFVDHSARYYPKYYWSYMGFWNVFFVKYNFKAEVGSYYIVSFLRITFVSFIIGSQYKTWVDCFNGLNSNVTEYILVPSHQLNCHIFLVFFSYTYSTSTSHRLLNWSSLMLSYALYYHFNGISTLESKYWRSL